MTHPTRQEVASEAAGQPARPALDRLALRPKDLATVIGVDRAHHPAMAIIREVP